MRNPVFITSLCLPGCLFRSQECRLVIHYERGFSVLTDPKVADEEGGEERVVNTSIKPQVLLSYPFEKLKMSSDDGVRRLLLDFGEKEGEIVSVYASTNHTKVFVMSSSIIYKLIYSNKTFYFSF